MTYVSASMKTSARWTHPLDALDAHDVRCSMPPRSNTWPVAAYLTHLLRPAATRCQRRLASLDDATQPRDDRVIRQSADAACWQCAGLIANWTRQLRCWTVRASTTWRQSHVVIVNSRQSLRVSESFEADLAERVTTSESLGTTQRLQTKATDKQCVGDVVE